MKKNKTIFLKEYEITQVWELSEGDIREIERLNNISQTELFEIKSWNRVKAKQFVGILRVGNKNIQVLPKIFWDDNTIILKNLLYMLSYTKKLAIKDSDIADLWEVHDLFEVFIYLFVKELIVLLKRDFKKYYNDREENSSFLKWRLIFPEHIKNNICNKSKFFIWYEQMDENFLLNIFLHSTCVKLLKYSTSHINRKLLSKCCFIYKDIDTQFFAHPKTLDTLNFSRIYTSYKHVFSLWKMLYFWNSPDFSKNIDMNFSLLFDMNQLFEEFTLEFLKKHRTEIRWDIDVVWQMRWKYVFQENKFHLRPDICIDFQNGARCIIDTKYKKLDGWKNNLWVSSQDIYQMFAYGMRYFWWYDTHKEKHIILLYPRYDEDYFIKYTSQENIQIFISTIDMCRDLSNSNGRERLATEIKKLIDTVLKNP